MIEITAGVRQLGVGQQAFERAAGGGLAQNAVDLHGIGVARRNQRNIEARHVQRRHSNSFGLNPPGKFRQQSLDAFRQTCGHRYDRLERRAGTAKVFVVISVNHRLIVHCRVNGGNRYVLQAERLIQQA